jgi:heme o synthase
MKKNSDTGIVFLYAELIKIKLSLAVTFSAVTGYFISQKTPDNNLLFLTAGVFLLASGAAVLNQISEIKYDALMNRTKGRPLPLDKISRTNALIFTVCLFCTGTAFLLLTGSLPAFLGFVSVFLYNFVYTRLKRITILAIVPGALVGAIPPFIGYSAAAGELNGTGVVMFSCFMFLWQLPHFWLILLKNHEDYEAAGFATISFRSGENRIRIFVFGWVLVSTSLLIVLSLTGLMFNNLISILMILLNVLFILLFCFMLFRKSEKDNLRSAFMLMNTFNLLIMILFIVNSFLCYASDKY